MGRSWPAASADRTVKLWDVARASGAIRSAISQELYTVAFSRMANNWRLVVWIIEFASGKSATKPLRPQIHCFTPFAHEGAILRIVYSPVASSCSRRRRIRREALECCRSAGKVAHREQPIGRLLSPSFPRTLLSSGVWMERRILRQHLGQPVPLPRLKSFKWTARSPARRHHYSQAQGSNLLGITELKLHNSNSPAR